MHDRDASVEIDRLVDLARTILDPGLSERESKNGRGSEHPRAPLPSARSKDGANGSANGTKEAHAHAAALHDLVADDGPPSPDHALAFLGRGTAVPIPELVGFLGSLGITGILRVASAGEHFLVEFVDGQISHGEGTRSRSGARLGDLLIRHGAIDRLTLEEHISDAPGTKLGRKLVQAGVVTETQLLHALQVQIQMLFCRLFREKARSYTFWSGPSIWGEQGVRLNSTTLLLEGARVSDEFADRLRALDETDSEEA